MPSTPSMLRLHTAPPRGTAAPTGRRPYRSGAVPAAAMAAVLTLAVAAACRSPEEPTSATAPRPTPPGFGTGEADTTSSSAVDPTGGGCIYEPVVLVPSCDASPKGR